MTEEWLNNVLLLNVHREEADNLELKEIACMFVASSQRKKNICLATLCDHINKQFLHNGAISIVQSKL